MIRKINHIGIAVKDLEASLPLFREILGVREETVEALPERKVRVAEFALGGVTIELIEALTPDSVIASFIEKKGEGIHHIALETDDIRAEIGRLKSRGIEPLSEAPSRREGRYEIAFLRPRSTGRVLFELCQPLDD